ncbi:TauD/TfdA family dioxygenase [Pseudomonas cichorii]|nr:TauD/TfdA family dioxygenase [Pseudomonas cichorii]
MKTSEKLELETRGYLLLQQWHDGDSTEEIARMVGSVLDVEKIAVNHKISTVQTLKPRETMNAKSNTYSGTFGLGEFPLHTDYAHWDTPPRYLILRCLEGASSVSTLLLPSSVLFNKAEDYIVRAVLAPRRKHPNQSICTMPAVFFRSGIMGLRWDSLFLKTVNEAAVKIGELVKTVSYHSVEPIFLSEPCDTLIIDNWRTLHGRSSVPPQGQSRNIERVYLSDLW